MATRIYLPNTGSGAITPAFGAWTVTQTVGSYAHGVSMNSISTPILRNHFVSMAW